MGDLPPRESLLLLPGFMFNVLGWAPNADNASHIESLVIREVFAWIG